MSIIFSEKFRTFSLHTNRSTYQMKISDMGYLLHVYYGERIKDEDLSYLITYYDRGFSPNPNQAGNDRTISLDVMPQEFSGTGAGDFRISSIEVDNSDGSRDFEGKYAGHRIYKGKYKQHGLPGIRVNENDCVDTVEIDLKDEVSGLKAVLCYTVFENLDIITRKVHIVNEGSGTVRLNKIMSVTMDYIDSDYDFIHFDGRHAMEREMHRDSVHYGQQSVGSLRGTSSHQHNPFVVLCSRDAGEAAGSCYGFSFVYSGNFQCVVQKDQYDQLRLVMGIHPECFAWPLNKGDVFDAPEVVMAYTNQGFTELSHIYHDVFRTNLNDSIYMKQKRPVLINSWEAAYFDFNHETLVKMAKNAACMGVDLFVLDDGWFGERNDDTCALGDWEVNTEKLSKGLKGLVDEINEIGLDFGIWIEPEMVSENSRLYLSHPEWALKIPKRPVTRGRYQLVLDLSRKDVRDYIVTFVNQILDSANIKYVKWDMNRSISDAWSGLLDKSDQGKVMHQYVLGLYEILDRLVHEHPNVLFEGCSGGGGRFDAGMLYYHPQIWCSDNTDAINRLKIQYGTSFGYPVSSMGAHVSVCPNHQTGRTTPLQTRAVTAMSGTFGYELDPGKMTSEEKEQCRYMTEQFKKYNDLIFNGDYYRLESPYGDKGFAAWAYISKDKEEGLASVVITDKEPNDAQRYLKFRGLKADAFYEVDGLTDAHCEADGLTDAHCEADGFEGAHCKVNGLTGAVSGRALMCAGIPIDNTLKEYESVQFHIRLHKNNEEEI